MLDKKTEQMLQIANLLTTEELDEVRTGAGVGALASMVTESATAEDAADGPGDVVEDIVPGAPSGDPSRGERERMRTRESKVSTRCLGTPREAHTWWPVGTELEGRIGAETFTATVVSNSHVKSGRSVLITSGSAQGRVCITPTRAAIEATEEYRRIANLGRGGGITNGWTFWTPKN